MRRTLVCFAAVVAFGYSWLALADLDSGMAAVKRQDYKKAFKEIESAAKAGNPTAQMGLGYLFEHGYGVTKSHTQSLAWYRKAAAQGNAAAMERVGTYYAYGLGVKQDMASAVDWLRKATDAGTYAYFTNHEVLEAPKAKERFNESVAFTLETFRRKAEQGDIAAQVNLGYMYMINLCPGSESTACPSSQAEGWFRKAAEKGNSSAQALLGLMYKLDSIGERDQVQAAKWYQLAANQGNANAQYRLATIYAGGSSSKYSAAKTVSKNIGKAKEWALMAAEQGFVEAQVLLGSLLLSYGTSEKDYVDALSWLRKGAKQADPLAQVLIGDIYVMGAGVPKDYVQAITWYRKAIDGSGSQIAYKRLGHIYEEGIGVPKDNVHALQLYEKAGDSNFDGALHVKLARMYENGVGTPIDESKAYQHYLWATIGGDIESMNKLGEVFEKGLLGQKSDPKQTQYWKERVSKESISK